MPCRAEKHLAQCLALPKSSARSAYFCFCCRFSSSLEERVEVEADSYGDPSWGCPSVSWAVRPQRGLWPEVSPGAREGGSFQLRIPELILLVSVSSSVNWGHQRPRSC